MIGPRFAIGFAIVTFEMFSDPSNHFWFAVPELQDSCEVAIGRVAKIVMPNYMWEQT